MHSKKDIILAVDYHAENTEIRWFNCASGQERRLNIPTTRGGILRLVEKAAAEAAPVGGKVVWIMESTTGWARVKDLIGARVHFVMANVLQMPLPPKAYRRKSDKIDTGRMLREFLNGSLPQSYQPGVWWREVRREGAGPASSVHRTQGRALEQARQQAKQGRVEVVTRGTDGRPETRTGTALGVPGQAICIRGRISMGDQTIDKCCPQIALKTHHETVENRAETGHQRDERSPFHCRS